LDDRSVPAYIGGATLSGDVLTASAISFTGEIDVLDNGQPGPGNIRILEVQNGTVESLDSLTSTQHIRTLNLTTYAPNGPVNYIQTNSMAQWESRNINIAMTTSGNFNGLIDGLGAHAYLNLNVTGSPYADTLKGYLVGNVDMGAHLNVSMNGGPGWDVIIFDAYTNSPSIAWGATVSVNLYGDQYGAPIIIPIFGGPHDAGNDVGFYSRGVMNGNLRFNLQGSAGQDWVSADVTLAAGSNGTIGDPASTRGAFVWGEAGNDDLYLVIRRVDSRDHPTVYSALMDGGDGDDTGHETSASWFTNAWSSVEHQNLVSG
jgi:hypothetical protein